MPLESLGNGGFVATGNSIELVRLRALIGRLNLEINGIRFKGRPTSVIVNEMLVANGTLQKPIRNKEKLAVALRGYFDEVKEGLARS